VRARSDADGPPKSSTQKLNWADERAVIRFPQWGQRLAESGLHEAVQRSHGRAILGYLKWLKEHHSPATVASAKGFLEEFEQRWPGGPHSGALRWLFRAARNPETVSARVAQSGDRRGLNATLRFGSDGAGLGIRKMSEEPRGPASARPATGEAVEPKGERPASARPATRHEVSRVFAVLEGTSRFMARVAYGAGLRVSELILRCQSSEVGR
jgi:hypothetical protein